MNYGNCPYCGDTFEIWWLEKPEENIPKRCDSCGKRFRVHATPKFNLRAFEEEIYLERLQNEIEETEGRCKVNSGEWEDNT